MEWMSFISAYGSFFLFMFSIIEEIIVPLPSAIISISAGYLIISWPFPLSILEVMLKIGLAAGLGSTIGSLFLFYLSRNFVDVVIGNGLLGISRQDYEEMKRKFDSFKNRDVALVVLRAFPIIPFSVVTVIAGAYKYDTRKYLLFTFIGSFIRNTILGLIGYAFGEAVVSIAGEFEHYQALGTVIFLAGLVWGYVFYKIISAKMKKV